MIWGKYDQVNARRNTQIWLQQKIGYNYILMKSWSRFLHLFHATAIPRPVPCILLVLLGIGMPNCSRKTCGRFLGDTLATDIVNICHVPPMQHIPLVAIVHVNDFLCCKPAKLLQHFQGNFIRRIRFSDNNTGLKPYLAQYR
jgi:hypothetical protein